MIALPASSTPDPVDIERPRLARRSAGPRPRRRADYDSMSIPELCRVILDADAPRPRLVDER